MKKVNSQKGFSVIIVIVLIMLVAALSFGVWFIWQRNKDDNNSNNTNNTGQQDQNQNQNQNAQTNEPQEPDPLEGGKYLVIEEWGVRFELPEELRGDVTYGIETSSDKQTAWFEIGEIANLPGSECKLTEATEQGSLGRQGGIGVFVIRTPEALPSAETSYYYTPATNIHIGDYWFNGGRERYFESCVNDANKEQLVVDTRSPLVYALEYLKPVPRNNQ